MIRSSSLSPSCCSAVSPSLFHRGFFFCRCFYNFILVEALDSRAIRRVVLYCTRGPPKLAPFSPIRFQLLLSENIKQNPPGHHFSSCSRNIISSVPFNRFISHRTLVSLAHAMLAGVSQATSGTTNARSFPQASSVAPEVH